ncbi:MAG: site-2 protease family protein [Chloroflexi bacterium]|nr:site-2 protease family protein [Chloroflexota bacterium]
MLIALVSFLVVIAVLVLAHELGHFVTARAAGVKVLEFGLGFPPRLFGIRRGETVYSLNVIPLGGFVKLAGEEDPGVTGSLASKSVGVRLMVLGAGSFMNLILPILLFSVAFMVPHNEVVGLVTIEEVAPGSPAARAGIRPGDTILRANGNTINHAGDLQRYLQLNLGSEVTLDIKHMDGVAESVRVVPRWRPPPGQGATGVAIRTVDAKVISESGPFWRAVPIGVRTSIETFVLFKNGIVSMIIGAVPAQVTGPVGIAQITGEVARAGIGPLLEFAAFLSINLGIINILPLPALDGGRIAFVILEWVRRGRRIQPKTEALIHLIGFVTLIALILLVTYRDIVRIISGESLIP